MCDFRYASISKPNSTTIQRKQFFVRQQEQSPGSFSCSVGVTHYRHVLTEHACSVAL